MTTSRYREVFPDRSTLLVVVHVHSFEQMLRNVMLAHSCQAHGVFLVNHKLAANSMLGFYQELISRAEWPKNFWVGMNCLDLAPTEVFKRIPSTINGVWVDNSGIDHECGAQRREATEIQRACEDAIDHCGWKGLYFGGVAFKHQPPVPSKWLSTVASIAREYMDVVTTSGLATGMAADVGKLEKMRQGLGKYPLAIASGVTVRNFADYRNVVDCFLVSTGISSSFYELDPVKVSRLVEQVRA